MKAVISFALILPLMVACASSGRSYPSVPINGLVGHMVAMHEFYPESLRLNGISGLVSLNYSVSAAGVPQRIVVTNVTPPAFAAAAVDFLNQWRFRVPPNWAADGGPQRRFRARVKFMVGRSAPSDKWNPDDPLFTITGTR